MRDMVLVSHANPEDNQFARWLSLRLADEGYGVWCDLTKLLGGEDFWDDIEDAIRERTAMFIYVLSRNSNHKDGPRNELALARTIARAKGLDDFVIPVWIDDLPPREFNVELHRVIAIPFQDGWATGLAQLLEKLSEAGVPKKAGFNASAVSTWWRDHIAGTRIVRRSPETLATNWHPVDATTLRFHELQRDGIGPISVADNLPYPAVKHDQYLVSFAPASDFTDKLGAGISIIRTHERRINGAEPENLPRLWSYRDERRHLTNLLRQSWQVALRDRALPLYEFANRAFGFYYREGQIEQDTIWFPQLAGTGKGRRQIVGYKTLKGLDGYPKGRRVWHFALEAKAISRPIVGYAMRPHVLFSDDGVSIWTSDDRLHRARRSQCKNWWNDDWRDRITAMLHSLADESGRIVLRVGSQAAIQINRVPMLLESPVSYDEEIAVQPHLEFDQDAEDDDVEASESSNAMNIVQELTSAAEGR